MNCPVCGKEVKKQDDYMGKPFGVVQIKKIKDVTEIPYTDFKYIVNQFDNVVTEYTGKVIKYTCSNNHVFFMGDTSEGKEVK